MQLLIPAAGMGNRLGAETSNKTKAMVEIVGKTLIERCLDAAVTNEISRIILIVGYQKEKLKNLDLLIVNALRIETHPTHFNLEEALSYVAELKPKKTYFTHISHKLGLHDEVQRTLPENVFLAFDGLKIEI